jgi:hypothetical protein
MRKKLTGVLMGAAMLVGTAGTASAATDNQQFTIAARFGPNGGATSCQVVATGPIHGSGTCTVTDVSNKVTLIHIVLPNGTVDLRAKEFASTDTFTRKACLDQFTFQENFTIVGGTGAFANATGSGTDSGSGVFTAPRTSQGCAFEQGSGFVVATATGHVSLGGGGGAAV